MKNNAKVVIVTGAKRGIGKAISKTFARESFNLALCSLDPDGVKSVLEEINAENKDITVLYQNLDVSDESDVKDFIAAVIDEFGKIDVLINNAGVVRTGSVEKMSEDDWDLVLDTNTKGPFLMMKHVIPHMKNNKSGHIINVTSIASKSGLRGFGAYCSSKFALLGLSLSVKEELRKDNIQLTIVSPGAVDTDIWEYIEGDFDHTKMVTSEDIANAVLFAVKNSNSCTVDEIQVTPKLGKV
ncbi:MAG: SDR family oxidoreductase [Vampirovibrionia bacterium]